MTLTQNVKPEVYYFLTKENIDQIYKYIDDPMTAVYFYDEPNRPKNREVITSELIYYWMIAMQIPVEFQKWHLNRLLSLIKVCDIRNRPQKKMSAKEIMSRNRALNEARKKRLGTKG